MGENSNSVLVIGGGIAGIQASLDLAERGIKVELVEKKPCIGGRMAQLDKTFPTNDCSICILAPKLAECYRHPNITLHTLAEVKEITGKAGNFKAKLLQHARYIKAEECINCGICIEKCPMRVDDEFDVFLRKRRAIYIYFLQGVPSIMAIDPEKCLYLTKDACRICEKVCEREAIDFEQKDSEVNLNVKSIIVATGYEPFDPSPLVNLGYKHLPNVVTGLEFERMICASGPLKGHLIRSSDRKEPKKLAFINCVGSRDMKYNPYCSSVCCMYTTKEAMIAYEHDNSIQSFIFYIDLRAGGKGFREYIERGQKEYGIKYIKGKVAKIIEDDDKNPIIIYEDMNTSKMKKFPVDLVILATSMIPNKDTPELANILGIDLDKNNFFLSNAYLPLDSSKKGIYICGCCRGPMDIPNSVIDASGAAAKAAENAIREG
ncbi:MAG: CoB--CoM heterodisulfide reductase iron-sulfur subunit A family protein [Candidatus Lokiarchaeota archaeon]|nr:CoB--CoM heterodisulfide reductase iron-sulfur subunit A family protein [Candidatus Lokiarchaeota archaeon]